MIRRPDSRLKTTVLVLVTVAIVGPGAYGFISKFVEFVRTLRTVEGGGFTIVPIMNYLLVTAGFVCLLMWAIKHGMFRNVEGPKYDMLKQDEEINRHDLPHRGTAG